MTNSESHSKTYSKPEIDRKMKTLTDSTLLCFAAVSVLCELAGLPKTDIKIVVADCQWRIDSIISTIKQHE